MEGRDRAVVADPDVSSVGVVTEGFRGEGDRRRNVRQESGEFAVQIVIFYMMMTICLDFYFYLERKKRFNGHNRMDGWMDGAAYGIGHI